VATKATQSKRWGGDMHAQTEADGELDKTSVPLEEVEVYDRSMSPIILDITKLPYEEREVDILSAEEDRKALVSLSSSTLRRTL
jgi:cactin